MEQQGCVISLAMREEIVTLLRNSVHPHKIWQDILNIINALLSIQPISFSTEALQEQPAVKQEEEQG
jgi:hypothetical protein